MIQSVIITGSSGFLGRNLASRLAESQQTELIQVNRENGFDLSVEGWTRKIPITQANIVFHFAQSNRRRDFPEGAEDVFRVNIASTFELLEWSRKHGVKRFIFASTGNVYKNYSEKMTEDSACAPDTLYSTSKFSAEKIVESYSDFFEVINTRIFGLYGPGQKNNLVSNIIKLIEEGHEIKLDGDKGLSLTPLFIEDAIEAFIKLSHLPLKNNKLTLNLAGDEVLSLLEISKLISEITQKKFKFTKTKKTSKLFLGDNKMMKNLTGQKNLVNFKDGIRKTLLENPSNH